MSLWSNIARGVRDLNRARFRYQGVGSNAIQYGLGDTAFNSMGNLALKLGKQVLMAPYRLGKTMIGNPFKPSETNMQKAFRAVNKRIPGAAWELGKGAAFSLDKTHTAAFHATKAFGRLVTQKDPNSILGRSINPIAGDLMIGGGVAAGLYMAQRGARLNAELGTIDVKPVEGTIADYMGMGEEGAANSPYDESHFRTKNIEHFGTNNNLGLALALHYQRHNGTLSNGLHGMGVI